MTIDNSWQQRTELLLKDRLEIFRAAHILIVGLGGVGAYAAEMLVRGGIGNMTIVDNDTVSITNINRQLPALHSTIGKSKVEVLKTRFMDINPSLNIQAYSMYLNEDNIAQFLEAKHYDFVVDAIDTITPKYTLIVECLKRRISIISSMGAGAKSDVTLIRYANIWDTYHCGLSKAIRTRLKQGGCKHCKLPVVFSTEQADRSSIIRVENEQNKKTTTGTISYMPATFGCYLAQYVFKNLTLK